MRSKATQPRIRDVGEDTVGGGNPRSCSPAPPLLLNRTASPRDAAQIYQRCSAAGLAVLATLRKEACRSDAEDRRDASAAPSA